MPGLDLTRRGAHHLQSRFLHAFASGRSEELMQLPSIETTRLRLRYLEPKDAAPLRDITDDPAITGAIQFLKSPFTVSDALKLIESRVSGVDCFFGVRLRESDQLIGVVGAGFTDDGEVEIGYWIGTSFQGEGYAQKAGRALVDLCTSVSEAMHHRCMQKRQPRVSACLGKARLQGDWRAQPPAGSRAIRPILACDSLSCGRFGKLA